MNDPKPYKHFLEARIVATVTATSTSSNNTFLETLKGNRISLNTRTTLFEIDTILVIDRILASNSCFTFKVSRS